MALLAVAPSSSLFGNNFRIDGTTSSTSRKPLPQDIIQQYSNVSAEALEIYGQYNYIHKKVCTYKRVFRKTMQIRIESYCYESFGDVAMKAYHQKNL